MNNIFTKNARRFRLVLIIATILAVFASIGVVTYGVKFLNSYAATVNEQVIAAASSETTLNNIRVQVDELEKNDTAAKRAKQIVAESKEYNYQDTIIRDIERFARKAGVRVLSYNFGSTGDAATAPQATPPPAPAQPPAEGTDMSGDPTQTPSGASPVPPTASSLRSTVVDIAIASPVNYRNFLNFLNYIEQNLTKMQISNVSLTGGDSPSLVTTNSFTVEVYVR